MTASGDLLLKAGIGCEGGFAGDLMAQDSGIKGIIAEITLLCQEILTLSGKSRLLTLPRSHQPYLLFFKYQSPDQSKTRCLFNLRVRKWNKNRLFAPFPEKPRCLSQCECVRLGHRGTKIGFFAHFCSAACACEQNGAEQTSAFLAIFRQSVPKTVFKLQSKNASVIASCAERAKMPFEW